MAVVVVGAAGRGFTVYMTSDGRPGSGRYTDIWHKRDGRWLAVAAHVTRLVR